MTWNCTAEQCVCAHVCGSLGVCVCVRMCVRACSWGVEEGGKSGPCEHRTSSTSGLSGPSIIKAAACNLSSTYQYKCATNAA